MPTIWLPPSHAIHNKPPKFACTLCEAVFTEDERFQFERHVMRAHDESDLRPHSPRMQAPALFDPKHDSGDVEWGEWIRRNNESRPEQWRRWMKTSAGKHSSGLGDG